MCFMYANKGYWKEAVKHNVEMRLASSFHVSLSFSCWVLQA